MTDEGLANDYALENYEYYGEGQTDYKALKRAFLAGLKAGRPKWHVLQGGIQVLPAVNETVLDENGNQVVYVGHDNWMAYSEYLEAFDEIETPKAWCEIPTYTEV